MQKEIAIQSKYLTKNIKAAITEQIREKMEKKCSQRYGYILKIINVENIINNYISRAYSNIVVKVNITLETLKPEIGGVFQGKVIMLDKEGIFILVKDVFKIMIPSSTIKEQYFFETDKFLIEKGNKKYTIKYGDILEAEIKNLKYEKNRYSCIGVLKL